MSEYRPLRPAVSSPAPIPSQPTSTPSTEDVSVRSMRLKVLYSFDSENKTNCLARWPQAIDIRTVHIDESTQIGVIELKTCIQAIVAASPELVAKLGQDYTVYAYDYSEYETPLVGQGMLSWVLASASSTPSAPAHQSRTIVTGRVCRNILGLFASSTQETLEVKLRLVPVPTSLQSEYIESMKKYRDISQMMPEGFDPQAWTNFLQANPNFLQSANQSRSQSPAMGAGQASAFRIEHVHRLLSGDGSAGKSADAQRQCSNSSITDVAAPPPRPSSAASSVQSTMAPKRRGRPPGVKTAARGRGVQAKKNEARPIPTNPIDSGYISNDERVEEGSNRKRAKVMQAEWPGKNDFAKQPESLRVAASTAASVRIHQPTAVRPNDNLATSLEGPPREPTPIADSSNRAMKPQLPPPKSSLRRGSFATEHKTYASPYIPPKGPINPGESALTSPEASQAESSPVDIASSPPVYQPTSTAASSPSLPNLPRYFDDSGLMSGSIDDLFGDDELRPIDDEDIEVSAHYIRRPELPAPSFTGEYESRLPETADLAQEATQQGSSEGRAAAQKRQMAANARLLSRTASYTNLAPPPVPASDPVRPTTLNRSQTWSGNQVSHPNSDVPLVPPVEEGMRRLISRSRQGSDSGTGGARRKQAIQSKLVSSVAAGEMPPFCENCGAIETPTWRKAWVKIHSGTPEHVVISEEEGGIIAWQTLQTDHEGTVCLYRIIKKSILKSDEGFTEILLCNPCGLWLHTRKCMRPKDVWEKPQNGGDGKRKRTSSFQKQGTPPGTKSVDGNAPNGTVLCSDVSSPTNEAGQDQIANQQQHPAAAKHKRALSDHFKSPQPMNPAMDDASALAALQHAIKSSPHKFKGTEHVPIEVEDLTPKPIRRILFPSPTNSREAQSKQNSLSSNEIQRSSQKPFDGLVMRIEEQADKENCPPGADGNLDQSLEPDHDSRSKTPTPTSSKGTAVFKTPVRSPRRPLPTTGDFFSSAAKALLRPPSTPKRSPHKDSQPLGELSPFTAHLNQLLSETNNGSPGSQGFDFLSLPSLHTTPGRVTRATDFDFTHFDSQDLISTDVPMPSSPPAWFGVYEDPEEHGAGSLWGIHQLPGPGSTPISEDDAMTDGKDVIMRPT